MRRAGRRLHAAAARALTTSVNSTVRASIRSSGSRGIPAGPAITRARTAAAAAASPSTAAMAVTTADSAKKWSITRRRPAPSASRTAISRCFASALTSVRLATLAQATSSTRAAAAATVHNVPAIPPVMSSRSGTREGRGRTWSMIWCVEMPETNVGKSSAARGSTAVKSRSASATVTPGLRRATALYSKPAPRGSRGSSGTGIQTCVAAAGKWKPDGMTPTIARETPFTSSMRPRIPGSAPSRARHIPSSIRTTGGDPRRSSASVKARPMSGATSRTGTRVAEMEAEATRCGSWTPPGSATFTSPSR